MSISGVGSSNTFNYAAQQGMTKAAERIASGSKINSAADNAAGQAIAEGFSRQISGFAQASRNLNDGISYTQTADGALGGVSEGIQRIRELSLQAANGTLAESDRKTINAEAQQIKSEISRTFETASFNGTKIFQEGGNDISIQSGPNSDDQTNLSTSDFEQLMEDTGLNNLDLSTAAGAQAGLAVADNLQSHVDSERATLGAVSNRFESTINSLTNSEISAQESRSRIKDADLAEEVSNLVQNKVKQEASIALQAQANQDKKSVLSLLGNI